MLGMIGPLTERQAQFVEKITGGVMQMADMIEKILDAGGSIRTPAATSFRESRLTLAKLVRRAAQPLLEPARKNGAVD